MCNCLVKSAAIYWEKRELKNIQLAQKLINMPPNTPKVRVND